jgi:hypothetical protein
MLAIIVKFRCRLPETVVQLTMVDVATVQQAMVYSNHTAEPTIEKSNYLSDYLCLCNISAFPNVLLFEY